MKRDYPPVTNCDDTLGELFNGASRQRELQVVGFFQEPCNESFHTNPMRLCFSKDDNDCTLIMSLYSQMSF